jgi:uncharacterized membrane protein
MCAFEAYNEHMRRILSVPRQRPIAWIGLFLQLPFACALWQIESREVRLALALCAILGILLQGFWAIRCPSPASPPQRNQNRKGH